MRISPGLLLRRALVGCSALATVLAPGCPATAAPSAAEAESVNFTQRYRALQHGGIVRAANSSISCRTTVTRAAAPSCSAARAGGQAAVNSDFDMFYVDVDKDPNTYNSSLGEVRLPQGARVTYARLYWGGNLRVGEQKPPKDNGRVLFAEPDGEYKAVLADTVVGHRVARGADAFQASADVTKLVRASGSGLYTVAQVNVAMGRSAAGAWGGWTLMVAYEKESEPLRHLAMWDGFDSLGPREDQVIRLRGLRFPAGAAWACGPGRVQRRPREPGRLADRVDRARRADGAGRRGEPRDDVLNSTISEAGVGRDEAGARVPEHARLRLGRPRTW